MFRLDVGRILLGHGLCRVLGKSHEIVVLCHEIGLAVNLDHRTGLGIRGDVRSDHAFSGNARSSLAGLGATLDAQQFFRGLGVAVSLDQRLLAFHHAEAGRLAQLLHHACGNFRHCSTP